MMKTLLASVASLSAFCAPAFAGNVEAAAMDPEVIEAAAASSDGGMVVLGIMVAVLLLTALSSTSTPPVPT
ncbi:hypothetical protein TL5118_03923 [Thalassovita autumnalis]|uniref:Ferrochelatase n=1 Tax=Thalassovita autumnalis TaxID=2072972 RepID=A0A0P1G9V8_9RHOB|nr:hypothetical protein [Thalassovita autumnalis]CUH69952.1 hypothetical protein TL5118_03923 [Thalassovita autumnalis]CUH72418.1 hypothetical protein TL5120_02218 [Thalassovita autumnalis]|tara:strand:- start:93 stop:305 length:213 start_codon:yes stop_codon:yes gene_type:complete